ncbi:MAG: UDP-3-O-(3-hydroxymyristoyl)glucosamine N-acyltransferase [Verrucomicrobiales bacterium]
MSLSPAELSALLGVPDPGNLPASGFTGVSSLDEAEGTDISFLGNERYLPQLPHSQAGLVLVPEELTELPASVPCLRVPNPSLAFSKVVEHFRREFRHFTPGVAPGAHVAPDAEFDPEKVSIKAGAVVESGAFIGDGTEIGPGCVVGHHARIGRDCHLHAKAVVREFCQLGDRVILQPACVIGSDGFGYDSSDGSHQKIPQVGIVLIEDDVEVGSNTTIDRARFGKTVIGKGTKIDNLVQIGHNVRIGEHCLIVAQSGIAGSTKIGNHVTVAAQSGLVGHIEVGDHIVLAARAGVTKNLSQPGAYQGNPARPIKLEQRRQAQVGRLPKLAQRVKALEEKINPPT